MTGEHGPNGRLTHGARRPRPTTASDDTDDERDRHRRRVLWALPTGLYLVGSRFEDTVNLMTANLVVQVCLEPKLVAVAIEAESVTAGLVDRSGAFTVCLLSRQDKDVVRRFVKPVHEVVRSAEGDRDRHVRARGARGRPGPPARTGDARRATSVCAVVRHEALGSHTLYIGEVEEVGGEPADVLRMEDTRMHYGG